MTNQSRVVVRFNHIPRVRRELNEQAGALIRAVAFETERYIKQSFGDGRSSPGQPPGVDTGALRASIHTTMTGRLSAEVADGVSYGVHLEYGTSRMAARPFMLPALVWASGQVERIAREMSWV